MNEQTNKPGEPNSNDPRSPSEPAKPTMTAMEAFEQDPAFQDQTIELAKGLAQKAFDMKAESILQEAKRESIAKVKKHAIYTFLGGEMSFEKLLPDTDDPSEMEVAINSLRAKLQRLSMEFSPGSSHRKQPSALDLVKYELRQRAEDRRLRSIRGGVSELESKRYPD